MNRVGIIGGTGATLLVPPGAALQATIETEWGRPSAALRIWRWGRTQVCFLPRHGAEATIPPHLVNYRANVQLLSDVACDAVVGINAVGGITVAAQPGGIVIPDQLIDYTWGREHSFSDGVRRPLRHVEFDPPFDEALRAALAQAAASAGVPVRSSGTYGATQGPRLETAAEIARLAADGCDLVGMTAMPEAALAREAGLAYAVCAVVVNRAAGRLPPGDSIHADMQAHLASGMERVRLILDAFFGG